MSDDVLSRVVAAAAEARGYAQQVAADKVTCQSVLTQIREYDIPAINTAKEAIRQAIVAKGVSVPVSTTLAEFSSKIASIETGSVAGFDTYLVTAYTPYRAALTAPSSVTISGLPGEIDGMTTGYDAANGVYNVTSETQYNTALERVYKHTSQNYWLIYFWDEYNAGYYWAIVDATQKDSPSSWNCVASKQGSDFSGSGTWNSQSMYYWTGTVTAEVTSTTYPQQNQVLTGKQVSNYDTSTRQWTIGSSSVNLLKDSTVTPKVDFIYYTVSSTLIGTPVGINHEFLGYGTLFAIDANVGLNELVNNITPTVFSSGTVLVDHEFCFDGERGLDYAIGNTLNGLNDFTVEMDFTITNNNGGECMLFWNTDGWGTDTVGLEWGRNSYGDSGWNITMYWHDHNIDVVGGTDSHPSWRNDGVYHHTALVRKGDILSLFVDGKRLVSCTGITKKLNLATIGRLTVGSGHHQTGRFPGRMRHFRVVPYALYEDDFTSNLPVWVGYRTPYVSATSPVAISGVPNEALTSVSLQATASNSNTVTFALQSGSTLPSGVSLSSAGIISGTPTAESSATCNIVASAVGCIDAVIVVNFAIAEPSASTLPSDLTTHDAIVTISSGSYAQQETRYTSLTQDGSGNTTCLRWIDENYSTMTWLIYAPYQDGTGPTEIEWSTNHKWSLYNTGELVFYCDDENPIDGQWYTASGESTDAVTVSFILHAVYAPANE